MDNQYEFVGINPKTSEERIPHAWNEQAFASTDLPDDSVIHAEIFRENGEVQKAKAHLDYIGYNNAELETKIPVLIHTCLAEMNAIETVARQPAIKRLEELKKIASSVTRIVVRSAPGDYYHLNKKDRYEHDPAMQGADRVRGDQAAILAIVLAGIKANWKDDELLFLLNQHILMDNDRLSSLRERAKQAVAASGIRLVYTGQKDETDAVKRVLSKSHTFVPEESVDILDPAGIKNTIDQTRQLRSYLAENLHSGDAFIEVSNVQAVRSMRMEKAQDMIPKDVNAYLYAMPTVGDVQAIEYRKGEIRGAVFYALIGQASFDPAPHSII